MRLIDAYALQDYWIDNEKYRFNYYYDLISVLESIDKIPTIDPETLPIVQELKEKLAQVTEKQNELKKSRNKDIQTEYNGYKFRSRLEAQWAVFFDTIGIEYQYEPEDGTRYLPDFYLPKLNLWVEVKPFERIEEIIKSISFLEENREKRLVILEEIPYDDECGFFWHPLLYYNTAEEMVLGRLCLISFPDRIVTGLHSNIQQDLIPLCVLWKNNCGKPVCDKEATIDQYGCYYALIHEKANKINKTALKKARQARFEHEEKP